VLNEFTVQGDTARVNLPHRCDLSSGTVTVVIDQNDVSLMDQATDKYWWYAAPCGYPAGVYLLCNKSHGTIGLARLLLNAPAGTWRHFKDGDALNCRRANLALMNHAPRQRDWLWSTPMPKGFTEIKSGENYITVRARKGADVNPIWQYLLERWQFIRVKNITITVPRIHEQRTSWTQRITAVIVMGSYAVSLDIGENGARQNQGAEERQVLELAA